MCVSSSRTLQFTFHVPPQARPWAGMVLEDAVRCWLGVFGMEAYFNSFIGAGYDDLDVIAHLDKKVFLESNHIRSISIHMCTFAGP